MSTLQATSTTATSSTTTSTLTSVSFVNLAGIFVSVVLVLMYLIFSGHALKYIKTFACKIKLISNRVEDKNIHLKDYNYQPQRQQVRATPGYQQMETVFKNEVRKSRSLNFKNIIGSYMAKYNHVVHYPFRDRLADKIDLLKPKSTFFNLIVVTQLCVVWMITILLSAILQNVYADIATVAVGTFIGLTVAISIIASLLNVLQINRLQHLYVLNIKNAFKTEREHVKFVQLGGDQNKLRDYSPENSMDEAEFQEHLEQLQQTKSNRHDNGESTIGGVTAGGNGIMTSRTMTREDNNTMYSSRKLLTVEDNDKNQSNKKNFKVPNKSIIMEDNEGEEYEYEESAAYSQHSAIKLKHPAKSQDYLVYQINEKNGKNMNNKLNLKALSESTESIYDKYAFIEDTHAIGEQHLLHNEAFKGENKSNVLTFGIIFVIIALACITCCYLNYTFPALLSKYIFYMFAGAFFMDMLVFRMLLVLLMAAIKYLTAKKRGYQKMQYQKSGEIKKLLGSALKSMMTKPKSSSQTGHDLLGSSTTDLRFKRKESVDAHEYENQTQGQYERHDTTMKQFNAEEQKEDEYAHEIDENGFKKTDHFGPNKAPYHDSYISNNPLLKNGDQSESPFKNTQGQLQLTQFSLLKGIQTSSGKPEQPLLMDKKNIVNELADYNLLLFRMIYDAYDERGERVIRKFRTDDHTVLRKRYMVPILNPNYDHEEWLKDQLKNKVNEEIGGEFEDHLGPEQELAGQDSNKLEPQTQDFSDDPKSNKVERLHIDKFGNLLSDKPSEITIVLPQPAFGVIENEKEHDIEEEDADEWSKKLKELQMLRAKKLRDGKLTDEENLRLTELEIEEDIHRHKEIEELDSLKDKRTDEQNVHLNKLLKDEQEYRNRRIEELQGKEKTHSINEEEKQELKRLLEWQKDQKKKLLEELRLKKQNGQLTEEETRMLKLLEDEEWNAKKAELDELREKLKRGTITDEERKRLKELEEEEIMRNRSELEELLQKLKNGTITEEELKRLHQLQEWEKHLKQKQLDELRTKLKNGTLTDEEKKLLQQLEEEEHRARLSELEMLRLKRERGELTEEERRRLDELEEWEHHERMKEIELLQSKKHKTAEEIARLKQLLAEEDIRVDHHLQSLYDKLARGEQLTEEELRQLKELEAYKYKRLVDQIEELLALGDDISDKDRLRLLFLQRELLKLEFDQLKRKNPPHSEEDQARMKMLEENMDKLEYEYLLLKQRIDTLTSEEEERLRELEARLKMNDLSQIDRDENVEDSHLFEEQDMLNEQQQHMNNMNEESYMKTEEAESRITDNDNFADLPPVEVIGSIKKPKSSESQRTKREQLVQENEQKDEVEKQNENYNFLEEQVVGNDQASTTKHHKQERVTSAKSEQRVRFAQDEEEDINSERFGLQEGEKLLQKGEKGYEEQQERINSARERYSNNTNKERRRSCSEYGLNENEQLLEEGQDGYEEQQERLQTARTGLRKNEKVLKEGQDGYEEQQERMKTAQAKYRDHLKLEEERRGLDQDEDLLLPGQEGYEEQQERLALAQNGGLRENEKLLEEGDEGYDEQQQRIQKAHQTHHVPPSKDIQNQHKNNTHQQEHHHKHNGHEQQRLQQNSSRQSNRQELERLSSAKSRQSAGERLNSAHSGSQHNRSNQLNSSRTGLREGERVLTPGEQGFDQQQERIKSAISQHRQDLHSAIHGLRDGERLLTPGEPGYEDQQLRLQQSNRSGKKSIVNEQERIKSAISGNRNSQQRLDSEADLSQMRPGTSQSQMRNHQEMATSLRSTSSRGQQQQYSERNDSKVHPSHRDNEHQKHHGMENYDRIHNDDMMEFGHDDLEIAAGSRGAHGQAPPDESIYSHKTSTILDEEKVSFMHIEHLPDQDQASDDSFAEQDMVYYNKDDLTNYSKGLGLNKVKAKPQAPTYYSENDIQEVHEGSISAEEDVNESRSLDARHHKRGGHGRGHIQHNNLEVQSYNDQIDGRLKVDSWNLNYNGKKKKHRKRKIDQSVQRRMDALQSIYGVDAKTLAGVNKARPAPLISGPSKAKDGTLGSSRISDNMSFRSTQNTFQKGGLGKKSKGSVMDMNSNLFSSGGFNGTKGGGLGGMGMSKRWNDIESTLKGGKIGTGGAGGADNQQQNISQYSPANKSLQNRQQPFGSQNKKLTSTQQRFNNNNQQEESKSRSNSRGGSNNNRLQSSALKKNLNKKTKQPSLANKRNSQGYDDYSESDEGVNDQNALFQRRQDLPQSSKKDKQANNKKNNARRNKETIIDNEIDHSESDEGVHEHDPNFQGGNALFERRGFDLSHQGAADQEKKHQTMKVVKPNNKNAVGSSQNMIRNASQGSDLELGGGAGNRGRTGANQTGKQGIGFGGRNSDLSNNSNSISPTKPPLGQKKQKQGGGASGGQIQQQRNNRGSYDANDKSRQGNSNNNNRGPGGSDGFQQNQKGGMGGISSGQLRTTDYNNNNNGGRSDEEDDDDQFIVGPESNHSMIQSRKDFNKQSKSKRKSFDDENVGYLSIHNQKQGSNYESNTSPDKKRKVKRAAHSQNDRDMAQQRLQAMKMERLKKSQMQAENALFDKNGNGVSFGGGDDQGSSGGGMMKKKKKRQAKESVRKEVNYWLDYDSPYAEYLVARFREWSPNVKPVQSRGGDSNERQQASGKYKEIQNVYAKEDSRHNTSAHNKKNSVSPNRVGVMNLTSNSIGNESVQVLGNQNKGSKRTQKNTTTGGGGAKNKQGGGDGGPTNQLYFHEVEDYDEEN